MLNLIKQLENEWNIPTTSIAGAVQRVRAIIEEAAYPRQQSTDLIRDLTDVEVEFDDVTRGRIAAQVVVEAIVRQNGVIDNAEELVHQAVERANAFRDNPANAWMYAAEQTQAKIEVVQQVIDGIETKVAVTSEGKIKKGGKAVLAEELYKKHVLEADAPLSNQEFVALLMKELQMTKSGATTYAHTTRKKCGEPEGGIVKAKKGRKPKES